jgi:hypothetical protein
VKLLKLIRRRALRAGRHEEHDARTTKWHLKIRRGERIDNKAKHIDVKVWVQQTKRRCCEGSQGPEACLVPGRDSQLDATALPNPRDVLSLSMPSRLPSLLGSCQRRANDLAKVDDA